MAVARSSSDRVTKSQGEGAIVGVFFPIDNALYNIAFGTHTKTAEPIEMPSRMMSGLGPRNCVLRGSDHPPLEWAIFGKQLPDNLIPLINANWIGPCSGTQQRQTLDFKRWTSLLSAAKWAVRLHSVGEVWYLYDCLVKEKEAGCWT